MFQWTEKFEPHHDWVNLLVLLIFGLIAFLSNQNYHQLKLLVSFWNYKNYLNIYDKDKFTNPLNLFNLVMMSISLISFSIIGFVIHEKLLMSFLGEISFLLLFGSITGVVVIRYWVLKLIFSNLGVVEFYQHNIFRSISFHFVISVYGILMFSVYYYSFIEMTVLLLILLILIVNSIFIFHFSLYAKIIGKQPSSLIYLILYLCAFKIAPWLWLYNSIY